MYIKQFSFLVVFSRAFPKIFFSFVSLSRKRQRRTKVADTEKMHNLSRSYNVIRRRRGDEEDHLPLLDGDEEDGASREYDTEAQIGGAEDGEEQFYYDEVNPQHPPVHHPAYTHPQRQRFGDIGRGGSQRAISYRDRIRSLSSPNINPEGGDGRSVTHLSRTPQYSTPSVSHRTRGDYSVQFGHSPPDFGVSLLLIR